MRENFAARKYMRLQYGFSRGTYFHTFCTPIKADTHQAMHNHANRIFYILPIGRIHWHIYMFNMNRRYNQPIVVPIVDQEFTFQCLIPMGVLSKYDRRGYASPSGYGPLVCKKGCTKIYDLGDKNKINEE